jgi:hypothetical protein
MALSLSLSKLCWKQQKVNFLGFRPRMQRHVKLGQACHKGGYLEATKICTLHPGSMYEKWELASNNHIVTFAIHFFG